MRSKRRARLVRATHDEPTGGLSGLIANAMARRNVSFAWLRARLGARCSGSFYRFVRSSAVSRRLDAIFAALGFELVLKDTGDWKEMIDGQ